MSKVSVVGTLTCQDGKASVELIARTIYIYTEARQHLAVLRCSRADAARKQVQGKQPMTVPEHAIHYLEIVTPDVEDACRLYGEAYGWSFEATGPELGNSFLASLPGGSLCGIRAPMHDQEKPIVRTYLRVTDIEASARRVEQLGAQLAFEPMEIPGHGKIVIYMYGGIEQGLWQVP